VQERYLPENLPFHHSPIAIRYSPLAAVLMRRKFSAALEGASPDAPKIFGSAGALPSRKLVIRYSPLAVFPPSRFADDLRLCHDLRKRSARFSQVRGGMKWAAMLPCRKSLT
jgi:hypothetical protein